MPVPLRGRFRADGRTSLCHCEDVRALPWDGDQRRSARVLSLRDRRDAKVKRRGWGRGEWLRDRAGGRETGQLQRSDSSVERGVAGVSGTGVI